MADGSTTPGSPLSPDQHFIIHSFSRTATGTLIWLLRASPGPTTLQRHRERKRANFPLRSCVSETPRPSPGSGSGSGSAPSRAKLATRPVLPAVCGTHVVSLGNGNPIWLTAVGTAHKDDRKCFITLLQLVQ